jgi:tyrosinase
MVATKQLSWLLWAVSLVSAGSVPKREEFTQEEIVQGDALSTLASIAYNESIPVSSAKMAKRTFGGSCNLSKLKIRQEWRTLSANQRKNYISAVKCMKNKPSILAPGRAPASKSLFDDFIVIHFEQTIFIHLTGSFLIWHRWFTHVYEQHLQQCGYTGAAPYWEWGLDINNPAASPVFDGSATSLGGNGAYFPHPGLIMTEPLNPNATIPLPPGTGGGCVTTGPFGALEINIGAAALPQYGTTDFYAAPDPLGVGNTRCLKRDLNAGVAKRFNSFYNTTSLILGYNTVELFQAHMQADPRYVHGELGVHGGGHYIIGGDPGGDPFISPGDPAFYLHHGQVDRVYWIWQMLDFNNRKGVHGSNVFMDIFPSANTTVEDVIDLSPLAAPVKIKDLMNTVGGTPLCYAYL